MTWQPLLALVVGVIFGQVLLAIQMQQRGAGFRTVNRAYRASHDQVLSIVMIDLVSATLLVAMFFAAGGLAVATGPDSIDIAGLVENPVSWVTVGLAVPWFAGSIFAVGVVDKVARQVYGFPAFSASVEREGERKSESFAGGPSPKSVRDQAVQTILKMTSLESVEALDHASLGEYPVIRKRLLDNPNERLIFAVAAIEYCELASVEAPGWMAQDVLPPLDDMSPAGLASLRETQDEPFEVDIDQCCRVLMWMIKERHWEFVGRWMPSDPSPEGATSGESAAVPDAPPA